MQMRGQNPFVGGHSNNGYYESQNYYGNSRPSYSDYQSGHYGSYPDRSS